MAKDNDDLELKTITPPGRCAFAHVWEPSRPPKTNNEPQYSLVLVFPPETDLSDVKRVIKNAFIKRWGPDWKTKVPKATIPLRDASEYDEYGEPFDVPGAKMINVKSRSAPGVVGPDAKPLLNQQDFYSGCMARVSFYAHAYDTAGNQGVTLLLNNVQKTGEGKRLAGKRSAEDEFDRVDGGGASAAGDDLL